MIQFIKVDKKQEGGKAFMVYLYSPRHLKLLFLGIIFYIVGLTMVFYGYHLLGGLFITAFVIIIIYVVIPNFITILQIMLSLPLAILSGKEVRRKSFFEIWIEV